MNSYVQAKRKNVAANLTIYDYVIKTNTFMVHDFLTSPGYTIEKKGQEVLEESIYLDLLENYGIYLDDVVQ